MIKLSRRTAVRYASFTIAAAAALTAVSVGEHVKAVTLAREMEYGYLRSIEDLALSVDNIRNTLNKGMYATSPEMMNNLSAKLWSDASTAKNRMAELPMEQLELTGTYKFLSQVGNYARSLSKKYESGEELTDEEKENMRLLLDYAETASDGLWSVESQLQNGWLTFDRAAAIAKESDEAGSGGESGSAYVTNGFADVENGFTNYPTLIYDGPFSDHLMQKEPLLVKGLKEITKEDALLKARDLSGDEKLKFTSEQSGNLQTYVFKSENRTVAITKQGGLLAYVLNYRAIDADDNGTGMENAVKTAAAFIEKAGIKDFEATYHETLSGVCIINFAARQSGVTLYTDLIKVGVAMDTGEVVSYDACGYIANHTERKLSVPKLSEADAMSKVSKRLSPESSGLAVIPSEGMNELFCYEFKCRSDDGGQVLVYINANTGAEEQILLLKISESGVLTV
ncbi:MAG: germination protein YpeB [Oscillospiraceae bacterium]|jgi:germination protein YpeB|nr:germination protein YpeB [Oscillospiraceae bacterium]